ncbi:hypothetical protein AB6D11_03145 [Vibrio splendidus]
MSSAINRAQYQGVLVNQDLEPGLIQRDVRPFGLRIRDEMTNNSGPMVIMGGVTVSIAPLMGLTFFADALIFFLMFLYFFTRNFKKEYKFAPAPTVDPETLSPKEREDVGILFWGNSRLDNTGVWFTASQFKTHVLLFGSTGSGKTRSLLSVMYQALLFSSGVLYCDGKGDITVWWLVFSLTRKLDRVNDLLILNYLTSPDPTRGFKERLTNTTNPFSFGDAEQLRSLLMGLMRDGGGDDIWKGRASAMTLLVLNILCYLRDIGEIELSIKKIRETMNLDKIVDYSRRNDFPEAIKFQITSFLDELPGYKKEDAQFGNLDSKCYEQFSYLSMQLSEILAQLTDTYGAIFSVTLGEIDYRDLVFNRRILFVLLPAISKDPDALAGLGKLVVAGIRSALEPALGSRAEGSKKELLDVRPTMATYPFIIILDEYGFYAVRGFAIVAAQARSLNIAVLFCGQDLPGFEKASKEEAAQTVSNTNIKGSMKLEDPDSTFSLFEKRGGKARVSQVSGYEQSSGMSSSYDGNDNAQVLEVNRVNLRDLVKLKPGQCLTIFGDTIEPVQMFFADPQEVEEVSITKCLMVHKPNKDNTQRILDTYSKFDALLSGEADKEDLNLMADDGINQLMNDFSLGLDNHDDPKEAAAFAIGMVDYRNQLMAKDIETQSPEFKKDEHTSLSKTTQQSSPPDTVKTTEEKQKASETKGQAQSESNVAVLERPSVAPTHQQQERPEYKVESVAVPIMDDDEEGESLEIVLSKKQPQQSIRKDAQAFQTNLLEKIHESVSKTAEKQNGILSPQEKEDLKPSNQLARIGELSGLNEKESSEQAQSMMDTISQKVAYTSEPIPTRMEDDDAMNEVETIIKLFSKANPTE